jgi:hypothetical protein
MGVAAYNRGSRAIRARIDRELEERRTRRVEGSSAMAAAWTVTLRCDPTGTWWALNKREHGFASFGYPFPFLGDALDKFGLTVAGFGTDAHGMYLVGKTGVAIG